MPKQPCWSGICLRNLTNAVFTKEQMRYLAAKACNYLDEQLNNCPVLFESCADQQLPFNYLVSLWMGR